jgi:hypothetical protein
MKFSFTDYLSTIWPNLINPSVNNSFRLEEFYLSDWMIKSSIKVASLASSLSLIYLICKSLISILKRAPKYV